MAPPRWQVAPCPCGQPGCYAYDWGPEDLILVAPKRSIRRHHRERVIANRTRFLRHVWPDTYSWWLSREERDNWAHQPGRLADIHPGRFCSCEMCHPGQAPGHRQRERDDWRRHHAEEIP